MMKGSVSGYGGSTSRLDLKIEQAMREYEYSLLYKCTLK